VRAGGHAGAVWPRALFTDMVIYKLAPDGRELWSTRWGDQFQEKLFSVAAGAPYVLVAGLHNTSMDPRESEMVVLALDPGDGRVGWEFRWSQGPGYEEVDGLVADGEFIYVSGWTTGAKTGNDLAILKLTREGELVWAQTWGSDGWDQADGQLVVDADTLYVAGRYDAANILAGGRSLLIKFRKDTGAYIAHTTWDEGALGNDALGLASDGTYLYPVGLTIVAQGGGQIFVRKYTKDLEFVWEQLWGGSGGESARAIAVTPNGQILIAGETYSDGAGKSDVALLLYGADGKLQWSRTWGGPRIDNVQGLRVAGDFVYLAGVTESFGQGQSDALLIKAAWAGAELPPASTPAP
jgi:hypothetical protein